MKTKTLINCLFFAVFSLFVVGISFALSSLKLAKEPMIDSNIDKQKLFEKNITDSSDILKTTAENIGSPISNWLANRVTNIKIQSV